MSVHLNDLIKKQLRVNGPCRLMFINTGAVRDEADRLAAATGRDAYRIIDASLKKFKREGVIVFDSKKGWSLT